jgi:hypothetical protein
MTVIDTDPSPYIAGSVMTDDAILNEWIGIIQVNAASQPTCIDGISTDYTIPYDRIGISAADPAATIPSGGAGGISGDMTVQNLRARVETLNPATNIGRTAPDRKTIQN